MNKIQIEIIAFLVGLFDINGEVVINFDGEKELGERIDYKRTKFPARIWHGDIKIAVGKMPAEVFPVLNSMVMASDLPFETIFINYIYL
jgi:hypothetical protein